jgi:catechol 2,3-dioxygenase-like lactoylglutathione lyase family enzyme
MEASIDFFQRFLGAEVLFRRNLPDGKRITYLRLREGILELMDMGPARELPDPGSFYGVHHVGIKVDDLEATYRDLKEKGAEFVGEPFEPIPGIKLVFLKEPNGAMVELAQRDPAVFEKAARMGTVEW